MPLKLTRTVQQAIVVHPKDDPEKFLMIRVMDIVPNAVCHGLMGDEYSICRAEKFGENNNAYHEGNNNDSSKK